MKKGTILIVDDNKSVLTALEMLLCGTFTKVITITTPNRILDTLDSNKVDVILLDMNFSAGLNSGNEGLYWLNRIKDHSKDIPVVLFTAYADIELAVKVVKEGATDFIVKPWDNAKLIATLLAAYRQKQSNKEIKELREKEEVLKKELKTSNSLIWGESSVMKNLRDIVQKVARTNANILITGENGTGKELIAQQIHNFSDRNKELMISVDMGAITETLFESELFGHVKGAFTDAKDDRAGKFEVASGGTLFLDEIGNLSFSLQSKLLTAIQSRKVTRIGSNTPIDIDIRLISATNCNLNTMVMNRDFREDLLYRINTIHLEVPPLRERGNDILILANHFLEKYSIKYGKKDIFLTPECESQLLAYYWPGNVRELQHAIEKAVILTDDKGLKPQDFMFKSRTEQLLNEDHTIESMEKIMIMKALSKNNNNMTLTSNQLGITRQTLYNKLKKYGLE